MEYFEKILYLLHYLLPGLKVTLSVTGLALSTGFVFGLTMAVLRVFGGPVLSLVAALYSNIVRAIPVVLIIFILFFIIAEWVDLSPFLSGALALGFASGAYQSEIFRGAIQSIPPGQIVAARAIGMSRFKAIRHIVIPQAVRLAIPGWSNEVTLVLKDSTLVFVIGVPEILRRAQYISSRTLEPFMAFCSAAVFYVGITYLASRGLDFLEKRYQLPL